MSFQHTHFLTTALIRWADAHLVSTFVMKKGDRERGLIVLKQELKDGTIRIWTEQMTEDGQRAFRRRFGEDQSPEEADAFLNRESSRDDDLWILVMENSDGTLPPVFSEAF